MTSYFFLIFENAENFMYIMKTLAAFDPGLYSLCMSFHGTQGIKNFLP